MLIKAKSENYINRVKQLDNKHLFAIGSDYFSVKIALDTGNTIWKTKLDFSSFNYAPEFFLDNGNIIFFNSCLYERGRERRN